MNVTQNVTHMRAPSGTGSLYLCGSYGHTGDTAVHTSPPLVTCPKCLKILEQKMSENGRKKDNGKPRWDLLPWAEVEEVVKVLTFGAAKYGDDNWRKVPEARRRYFAAAMRHLVDWELGALLDFESQLPHLAHAICSLLFLMALEREGKA